jgi:competence protein ComEC
VSFSSRDPPPAHGHMAALLAARPWHVGIGSAAVGLALATGPRACALVAAALMLAALAGCGAPALGALAAALVLGGTAFGELRLRSIDASAALVEDGRTVEVSAHLLTPPRPSAFGSSAEVGVTGGRLDGARLLLRVPRWARLPRGVRVGDELLLRGRLRGPGAESAAPQTGADARRREGGSFEFTAYLRRRGIAAELLLDDARATGRRRGGVAHLLDLMRERAQRAVAAGLPPPEAALERGMVLGQDEAIAEGVRDDFRASGLAHLLAVSGQNVMLLVALALPLLAVAGLGPRGRGIALLGVVAVYVPLAGAGPSLQRAGVMGAAGIAAMTLSRPASRWYALLLAAAATLALNPRAWEDPGWQLSFAAVVGILCLGIPLGRALTRAVDGLLVARGSREAGRLAQAGKAGPPTQAHEAGALARVSEAGPLAQAREAGALARAPDAAPPPPPRIPGLHARLPELRAALARGLAEGAAITLAATLATAPLLAHHFDAVPVAGLPANLLALPAVAPAMWLGMVKAGLGLLAPLLPPLDWLAAALGPLTRLPVAYINRLAELFAQLPGGQVSLPLPSRAGVPIAYLLLALAAVGVQRAARLLSPRAQELAGRWRRRPAAQRLALGAALAAAVVLIALRVLGPPAPPDVLTVRFLDVGQGDATLVQHPDGSAVLFDAGPPEAGTARLLRRAGVRQLTAVVATHASRDHHGGLAEVLARFDVGVLLDGGDGTPDPTFRKMLAQAARDGVRTARVTAPMTLGAGGLTIRILSPPPRPPGPAPEDPNPRAVVAVVSAGGFDLLLSADAESEALLPLQLPQVEAMKVPHHGSSDPGLPQVLERLRPQLAAIEVGPNTYGHPAPPTLAALKRAGVALYRTDRDGTVTLSVEGGEMHVTTDG